MLGALLELTSSMRFCYVIVLHKFLVLGVQACVQTFANSWFLSGRNVLLPPLSQSCENSQRLARLGIKQGSFQGCRISIESRRKT